jgi:hypothetical protein
MAEAWEEPGFWEKPVEEQQTTLLGKAGGKPASKEDPYFKQFQESQASVLGSAAGQLAATQLGAKYAQEAPGAIEKQQQSALTGARAKAGQAFAGQMAQGGGGSLAGMRQAQLSRGVAEGQLMSDFGMQKIAAQRLAAQAQKEAAQAAGEFATTQQKIKQQESDRAKMQIEEQSGVEEDIKKLFHEAVDNEAWWSDDDAKAFAEQIRKKYANWPNPTIKARAMEMADQIANKQGYFEE